MSDSTKKDKAVSWKMRLFVWFGYFVILYSIADAIFDITPKLAAWTISEELPAHSQPLIDQTDTLTAAEKQSITEKINTLEKQYGTQLSIALIKSTGGKSIESYSLELAEKWQLGREGVDDGLLIVVSKADRKMRIEVGYGLEGVITDAAASRIIRESMTPEFKKKEYGVGIEKGLDDIIALVSGSEIPELEDNFVYWEDYSPITQAAIIAVITVLGLTWIERFLAFDNKYALYVAIGSGVICLGVAYVYLESPLYILASGAIGALFMYLIFFLEMNGAKTNLWGDFKSSMGSRGSRGSSSRRGGGGGFGGGGSSGGW